MIEIKNLRKYYGKNRGVEDLSLSVAAGQIYGFVGPNGAGKSTTIRTMLGMLIPDSGSIKLFETGVNDRSLAQLKSRIGYLPSENFYYDRLTVGDLLTYGASYYKKDCRKRMDSLCEILSLDKKRLIEDLSFGNKKKVGIVQALMHEPDLLVLDEPTVGLDPLMQNRFYDLLREEKARGCTIFFSSHILSEVQRLCDRVGIIKEGCLIEEKDIRELRATTYKRVSMTLAEGAVFEYPENGQAIGLAEFSQEDRRVRFHYHGTADTLSAILSKQSLLDFAVEEPELEEIFMHYYGEEKENETV